MATQLPNRTSEERTAPTVDRRDFLRTVGAGAAAAGLATLRAQPIQASPGFSSPAETAAKGRYDSLTEEQRKVICLNWDDVGPKRGLLRAYVA